jgi:hypothetical protein
MSYNHRRSDLAGLPCESQPTRGSLTKPLSEQRHGQEVANNDGSLRIILGRKHPTPTERIGMVLGLFLEMYIAISYPHVAKTVISRLHK